MHKTPASLLAAMFFSPLAAEAGITIEFYSDRAAFEARLGGVVTVYFDDLVSILSDPIPFSPYHYTNTQGVAITGEGGQYGSTQFWGSLPFPYVSPPNAYAPGPIAADGGGGNRTDLTFYDELGRASVSGFGATFFDGDLPATEHSSLTVFDRTGAVLASKHDIVQAGDQPVFAGFIAIDDTTNEPKPVMGRVRLLNGNGWPAGAGNRGVAIDDLVYDSPSSFGPPLESRSEGDVFQILLSQNAPVTGWSSEIIPVTAEPFDGVSGDYLPVQRPINFEPTLVGDWSAPILVPILWDELEEGDEIFRIQVRDEAGMIVFASEVAIRDDPESPFRSAILPGVQRLPERVPFTGHQLAVQVDPPVPGAHWRLVGEPFWREPDPINYLGPLAKGLQRVEYKPVIGYGLPEEPVIDFLGIAPEPSPYEILFGDVLSSHLFEATYPRALAEVTGEIRVHLRPPPVILFPESNNPMQWRLAGEAGWRESGTSVSLPPGKHLLEFRDDADHFAAPTPRFARVYEGVLTFLEVNYLPGADGGASPVPLPLSASPGDPQIDAAPFQFVGQIETAQGYGTGVCTTEKTVLTAARVVWDPDRLASPGDVAWFNRRHADYGPDLVDYFLPAAQYPRGFIQLTDYAEMRSSETSRSDRVALPGDRPSDHLDVAVLYFPSPLSPSDGGFSGYLSDFGSDPSQNPWLLGQRSRFFAGYPLTGIPAANWGLMHATAPFEYTFTHRAGTLYQSNEFRGFPGMEGAPLFVTEGGASFPAAVYLGENGGAIFRVLDRATVEAIFLGGAAAGDSGGIGGSGGGYNPQFEEDSITSGFVLVDFFPRGGGWRLLDAVSQSPIDSEWAEPGERIAVPEGAYLVEFQPIPNLDAPAPRLVGAIAGVTSAIVDLSYTFEYETWAAQTFSGAQFSDPGVSGPSVVLNGLPNVLAYAFGLAAGQSSPPTSKVATLTPGMPEVILDGSVDSPRLAVSFLARNPELVPDLSYFVEFANHPDGPWIRATEPPYSRTPTVTRLNDSWSHLRVDAAPAASSAPFFARVAVELSP